MRLLRVGVRRLQGRSDPASAAVPRSRWGEEVAFQRPVSPGEAALGGGSESTGRPGPLLAAEVRSVPGKARRQLKMKNLQEIKVV